MPRFLPHTSAPSVVVSVAPKTRKKRSGPPTAGPLPSSPDSALAKTARGVADGVYSFLAPGEELAAVRLAFIAFCNAHACAFHDWRVAWDAWRKTLHVKQIDPSMKNCTTKLFPESIRKVVTARGHFDAFQAALEGKGDFAEKYELDGYQPLCIEVIPSRILSKHAVAVCHTFIQNGDLMRDPEIVFAVASETEWVPYEITQDPVGVYRLALDGNENLIERISRDILPLANMWARNLRGQGWHDAPSPSSIIEFPRSSRVVSGLNRLASL